MKDPERPKDTRRPRHDWKRYNERIRWLSKRLRRPVKPVDVVNDMLDDPEAPYRPWFTLDVKRAAWKRWLDEARQLLGRIRVRYRDAKGNVVKVREYVRVVMEKPDTHKPVGVYVPRPKVIKTAYLADQVLEEAIKYQEQFKVRFRGFPKIERVFGKVDMIILDLQRGKGGKFRNAR